MVEISASLLSASRDNIINTIYKLELAQIDYFHIDVMDGRFVENNTNQIMQEYCSYVKAISNIPLDIHLMVEDVEAFVKSYLVYEPKIISVHYEAFKDKENLKKIIKLIKENNCKVGLAISPNTPIEEVYEYLPQIHLVLIMTVEPGKGGQNLIEDTLEKSMKLKDFIRKGNIDVEIQVDGGITLENIGKVKNAGVEVIVSGVGILSSEDYKKTVNEMKLN